MPDKVVLGGVGQAVLCDALEDALQGSQSAALGLASAFVSVKGVQEVAGIVSRCGVQVCRLVAGIDGAITHPEALRLAQEAGWAVRLGISQSGIFHPKLVVAGAAFAQNGTVASPSCAYVGSGNLTHAGLRRNVECCVITTTLASVSQAAAAFRAIWGSAVPLTSEGLKDYAAMFAERSRSRSPEEIDSLGINDGYMLVPMDQLRVSSPPPQGASATTYAARVWAELKVFTGGYALQVEFPKAAGEVLERLIGALPADNKVAVACEDGQSRQMLFRYYDDNNMYRLNVPNSTPGVAWARLNKSGLALVERGPEGGSPIRVRLLRPGAEMDDTIARSAALGTWGRTRRRLYGWC